MSKLLRTVAPLMTTLKIRSPLFQYWISAKCSVTV